MRKKILIRAPQLPFCYFEFFCFRYVRFILMAGIFMLFSSCSMEDKSSRYLVAERENSNENDEADKEKLEKADCALWTILVYMAALCRKKQISLDD